MLWIADIFIPSLMETKFKDWCLSSCQLYSNLSSRQIGINNNNIKNTRLLYLPLQCRLPHMWQSNFRCLRNRYNLFRAGVPGMFGANVPGHGISTVLAPTSMWRHHDKHNDILLFGRQTLSTKIRPRKHDTSSDNKINLNLICEWGIWIQGRIQSGRRVKKVYMYNKVTEYTVDHGPLSLFPFGFFFWSAYR